MKKIILFPIFSFFCFFCFGQNAKIDSLMIVLKTSKEDTNRVKILNLISDLFLQNRNFDSTIIYSNNARKVAEKINFKYGAARSYCAIGIAFHYLIKYPEAINNYFSALKIYTVLGDNNAVAGMYSKIAVSYHSHAHYSEASHFYLKALKHYKISDDKNEIGGIYNNLGILYINQSNCPEALKNYLAALKIFELSQNKRGMANTYDGIASIYSYLGKNEDALKYYSNSLKIKQDIEDKNGVADSYLNIGSIYKLKTNYTESVKYIFYALKIFQENKDKWRTAVALNEIGDINSIQGRYPEALKNYFDVLKLNEEIEVSYTIKDGTANSYKNIGDCYVLMNRLKLGKSWLEKSLQLTINNNEKKNAIRDVYKSLSNVNNILGNYKLSLEQYKLYDAFRDSLDDIENIEKSTQIKAQYDFDKKEAATKAETEKKDVLAKAEINKQKIIRNSIAGGTSIVALSSIFSFMVYKRKREASFKNKVSEVEMKALRSQMNPHFIFNSLNSIKRYMANHDNKTAEDYLTKFANVMRMILENSEHKEVPLHQDLKALELYMQLETLRMKKKFIYEIKVDESIDQENTLIPPLILQPFVENSIWHGLAGKYGEGKISISINKVGEMIECIVEDNGVGREKAKTDNQEGASAEKKSLGMKITNARIDILNKIKKSKAGVELVDLAEGMKVIVRLPLELSF